MDSGLTGREQAKLDAEIARQEKQERVAGQQKLVREGQWQKQLKVSAVPSCTGHCDLMHATSAAPVCAAAARDASVSAERE